MWTQIATKAEVTKFMGFLTLISSIHPTPCLRSSGGGGVKAWGK